MLKTTQKQIKEMVQTGLAIDITNGNNDTRERLMASEGWLKEIAYSAGTYGCNGKVFRGEHTGTLYAITGRTNAIFIFG